MTGLGSDGHPPAIPTEPASEPTARPPFGLAKLPAAAGSVAILLGLIVLAGWVFESKALKSVVPGFVEMKANTAVGFVLLGVALVLTNAGIARPLLGLGRVCALGAILIGAAVCLEYLSGWDLGIDELFFRDTLSVSRFGLPPGRMAFASAVNFILLRLSIPLLHFERRIVAAQFLAAAAGLVAVLALLGYFFGEQAVYAWSPYTSLALHTATAFALLSVGALSVRPDRGPVSLPFSPTLGGYLVRRLVPMVIGVTVALYWVVLAGARAEQYRPEFGLVVFAVLNAMVLAAVAWATAAVVDRADLTRLRAEDALRRANEDLELRVAERTRALEGARAELERRVAERTAELAASNVELSHKNSENEMFVYSVSHDLRSPLVNLQGFARELQNDCQELASVLERESLSPATRDATKGLLSELARSVAFIQTATLRLSGIIDALLRLSRAGRVVYQRRQVDLNQLVRRVVDSLAGTIGERGAALQVAPLPPAWGDPTALEQVFANLIGNALKYLEPARPGRIEVGCSDGASDAAPVGMRRFFVRDDGLGIPEAGQQKIFQVFQRLHPSAAPGEGLGLAIALRIVDRHGGKIWVESQVGAGSTFFVTLPKCAPSEGTRA